MGKTVFNQRTEKEPVGLLKPCHSGFLFYNKKPQQEEMHWKVFQP